MSKCFYSLDGNCENSKFLILDREKFECTNCKFLIVVKDVKKDLNSVNKNISEDDVCKILKQTLYPYGYYLCKNSVCNTCVNTSSESTQNVTTDTVSN